jgi:hypothetical protein
VVGLQASQLVLLIGRDDPNLADWVNGWQPRRPRGGLRRLYEHWILMRGDGPKSSIPTQLGSG